jgi:hypothetical protein
VKGKAGGGQGQPPTQQPPQKTRLDPLQQMLDLLSDQVKPRDTQQKPKK